jgi:hypothetical protein
MKCKYVSNRLVFSQTITAVDENEFKEQFKAILEESRLHSSLVYVLKTKTPIPRTNGESPVLYIGKAKGSLFNRYGGAGIARESREYWYRYSLIIQKYGHLEIETHLTPKPDITENNFLFNYHLEHWELPAINLRSWMPSLLEGEELAKYQAMKKNILN